MAPVRSKGAQALIKFFVGSLIVGGGIILILRHLHVWRVETERAKSDHQKKFFWSQFKRRTMCSASIALLGVIIASLEWSRSPTSFSILIFCALILMLIILILAFLEFVMISQAVKSEEDKAHTSAQALVDEYHRLKKKADKQKVDRENQSD